jgi:hypothetical protein
MNTSVKSVRRLQAALGLALALGSVQAMAAIYDIKIKGTTSTSGGQVTYNNSDTASAGCNGGDHNPLTWGVTVQDTSLGARAISFNQKLDLTLCTYTTSLLKPGTGGQNELLKQGSNVEGLKGSLSNHANAALTTCTAASQFKLEFKLSGTTQPFTRDYEIWACQKPDPNSPFGWVSVKTGSYHINNIQSVPEPGSLLLLLPGLGALAWSRARHARRQAGG